jgi:hypothetical protein
MLAVREILERSDRIVTDRRDTQALLPDRLQMLFQLDELDLAERSPIRGAKKYQHGAFRSHDGLESLGSAFLVLCGKRGYRLAHIRPGLDVLAVKCRDRQRPERHFDERSFSHSTPRSWLLQQIRTPTNHLGSLPNDQTGQSA